MNAWPVALRGDFLQRIGAEDFARLVSVEVRPLGDHVAGEAIHDERGRRIVLAPALPFNRELCQRTFCHELAHLLTHGDGHGVRFLAVYATLLKRLDPPASPLWVLTLYEAQDALTRVSEALAFADEFAPLPLCVELVAALAVNRFGTPAQRRALRRSMSRLVA